MERQPKSPNVGLNLDTRVISNNDSSTVHNCPSAAHVGEDHRDQQTTTPTAPTVIKITPTMSDGMSLTPPNWRAAVRADRDEFGALSDPKRSWSTSCRALLPASP